MTGHETALGKDPARHLDPRRRQLVEAARDAVLHEPGNGAVGIPEPLRRKIAALTHRAGGMLEVPVPVPVPVPVSGPVADLPIATEEEVLAYAERMATDPASVREQQITSLLEVGLHPSQIVAISQVVGFCAFEARLEAVATALDEQPGRAVDEDDLVEAPEDLPHPRTRFAMRGWVGRLPLGGSDEDFPVKDNQKPNDYYRVLVHDPVSLTHRTALYDELLRGEGASTVEQREMAALSVSLITPCDFCASVHGRRHFLAGRDARSSVELDHGGPGAVAEPVQRAIARLGPALGPARPEVPTDAVALLRAHGLSDAAIVEIGAVAAMFAWANRLMTALGDPTD
ncbi:MAG: hypothetical protein DI635_14120 [Pseudoxanthomonas suwonensis]|nr:MAG: hypothetical protein DI635_14120 [Pseudoxanthomonas suwonensis]